MAPTRRHSPRLSVAAPGLVEAARAAARTKGIYYWAQYRRIAPHRGPNKAAVAVANSMLATIWHLLTTRKLYQDLGADYFERRHDPALEARRLARKIEALGFTVTVTRRLKSDNITSQLLAPPL